MATSALASGEVFPVDGRVRIDFTQVDQASTATTNTELNGPKYNTSGARVMTNKGPAVYCKVGTGGVIAGSYVALTQASETAEIVATEEDTTTSGSSPREGAIAIAAASANQYAWFLTGPFDWVPVDVANGVAAGAALTTTATAGQLGAGGDTVNGLLAREASGVSGLTGCTAIQPLGTNN